MRLVAVGPLVVQSWLTDIFLSLLARSARLASLLAVALEHSQYADDRTQHGHVSNALKVIDD